MYSIAVAAIKHIVIFAQKAAVTHSITSHAICIAKKQLAIASNAIHI